jgi:hypothetical protein
VSQQVVDRVTEDRPGLVAARRVGGRRLIVGLTVVVLAFFALNLWAARRNQSDGRHQREMTSVLADPSLVRQTWSPETDGMDATFVAVDSSNSKLVRDLQAFVKAERTRHIRADYGDLRFENRTIPGRADLEFGTENLLVTARYRSVDGGAGLRFVTTDSVMRQALIEWSGAIRQGP